MTYRVEMHVASEAPRLGPPAFATLNEAQQFVSEMSHILPSTKENPVLFEIFDSTGRLICFIGQPAHEPRIAF